MIAVHHTRHRQQKANRLSVAVSACLLGHEVRYDGSQKRHDFITQSLAKWLDLVPICPEVEIGMGVPRSPIQLFEQAGHIRALGVCNPELDVTHQLIQHGIDTTRRLEHIDGYIFKARSPSCGLDSTPIMLGDTVSRLGDGLFAAQIRQCLPLLPMVEEHELDTEAKQGNFLQRLFAYQSWRKFIATHPGRHDLEQFHLANRLILMAHDVEGLRRMTDWLKVNSASHLSEAQLQAYASQFTHQFTQMVTRQGHARVLDYIFALSRETNGQAGDEPRRHLLRAYLTGELSLTAVILQLRQSLNRQVLSNSEVNGYLDRYAKIVI